MRLRLIVLLCLIVVCKNAGAQAVGSWTNTGPVLFPVNVSGQVNGIGRVCQVKFHPTNPLKMYAVSASGGLFISTDNGATWAPTPGTEAMPVTSCASVCIDYTSDAILYLSTGDPDYYNDNYGIWKSTDGGLTFTASHTGVGNRMAVEILMDPANHNNLVAATDDGIWKTTNAGASWTETWTGGDFRSMKMKPGSTVTLYAATSTDFYRSTDMGSSWTHITSGVVVPTSNQGLRIAVSAADTNVVYIGTTDGYGEILKSTDGGSNFTNIYTSTTQCIVCYDSTITSGSQGDYNFNITANPANANELLLVSHCVWRSVDGGLTWSWRTQWPDQVHTDMHDIEFNPYNLNQRFNANDGGVWLSTDTLATTWSPRSNGLAASEVYHAAQSPTVRQLVSIGCQDNGELYFDDTWKTNRGGDWGPRCGMDYLGSGAVYYDNGDRRNLLPLGGDQPYNIPSTTGSTFAIEFLPSLTNVAFVGTDTVWRSDNINTSTPSWTMIQATNENVMGLASCRADNNILYVVTDSHHLYRSDNALDAVPTFTMIFTPAATNVMASVATDKYNSNIVYLTCNHTIYRSADKGATWANISGALPAVNIRKVIADEFSPNERLFVCEGNYVWYKDNTTPWTNTAGLPGTPNFTDMMIYNDSTSASILRVSTYGRGVWECNIFNNLPPTGDFVANKIYICPGDTVRYNKNVYGSFTSFSWSFPGGTPATSTADSPVVVYPAYGTYNAVLTVFGTTGNDTITRTSYINVSGGSAASITEGFEEASFPPTPLWSQLSQSGILWQQSVACGGFGLSAQSMNFDNFDNDCGGRHDRILTPKLDLSAATNAYMTFDVAYSYYSGYHDSLTVDVSDDCGKTFTTIYEKDSTVLATAPDTTNAFLPGATQWRTDTVSLNAFLGSHIQVAFDNIGHYGQNLYIDNVNIAVTSPLGVKPVATEGSVTVFPNPARDKMSIRAAGLKSNSAVISLYNEMGALISRKSEQVNAGALNSSVNVSALPAGIYELIIQGDQGDRFVKQVAIE